MRMNQRWRSDNAVAGIITAILIVGLIVIVISLIQTTYVPKWMKQIEAEHMGDVEDQFSLLKSAIDIQTATGQKTPMSTSITLGNKEIPYFSASRAFGSLMILSDECTVTITNSSNNFSYSLGIIKYSSRNVYFLDQSYIYEAGSVILNQSEGNVMSIKPFSAIKNVNVSITFDIVNITGVGGRTSAGGYGTYPIRTEFVSSHTVVMNDVDSITIATKYPNAWHVAFNSTLIKSAGLRYGPDFSVADTTGEVTIEFHVGVTVNLALNVIEINAQIAPGWIE
ncbi:MAG: hypothetical protein IMZ52_07565 [Actinobacteria bacterium]|nr:hypothetical protein [Actinomycetota bacterium]MBE3122376.1 hypothetical protein [Thermoplasmata archaeon]